jgi:hypothetical protein
MKPKITDQPSLIGQAEFVFPPLPLNPFQRLMVELDCLLTGHSAEEVAQQMHHKPATPVEWFDRGREWYLSDGGYSRVWVDYEGHLFLGSNSLDRVKEAWPIATDTRIRIEGVVQTALREADMI